MSAIAVWVPARRGTGWQELIGFNIADRDPPRDRRVVHRLPHRPHIHGANVAYYSAEAGENDIAMLIGYFLGVVGFLVGLGFANYPVKRMLGHPPALAEHETEEEGLLRYFTLSTDHKVVAKQYMVGIGMFFCIAGLNAMMIRTELLQPNVTSSAPTNT